MIQGGLASDVSIDDYVKTITQKNIDWTWFWLKEQDKQIYTVFNTLCNNIIASWTVTILPSWTTYNPKESLFVTIACNSLQSDKTDKTAENKSLPLNNILKRKNIRNMGIICSQSQLWSVVDTGSIRDTDCESRSFNNNMDYPFIFGKIITQVQNDRVNLSLARIYGAVDNKFTEKELANEYISSHFKTIWLIPEAKNYPDTYKRLTTYIKNSKNMQKEAYFIDYKNITKETTKPIGSNIANFLFIDDTSKIPSSYHKINTDILYNELFFYTLFTSVYTEYLNRFFKGKQDIPISRQQKELSPWESIILQRSRVQRQQEDIYHAVSESIRQLSNLESSYPIHIWFLMYQEDLLTIRNNLAKIYLPLHQLHYKLENVQSKN
jgi:hypothetical protein